MSTVTGPISSLPGSSHFVPDGQECDDCGAPAVVRIQGETDSFGCEMFDLCESCAGQLKADMAPMNEGWCDWCKQKATDLQPKRDYEEGINGPVYYVCSGCRERYDERIRVENEYDPYRDDWYP